MSKSDDFFGGAPSLSWARQDPTTGEWVDIPELQGVSRGGVVTAVGEPVQMTKIGTGEPLWWKAPSPEKPQGEPKLKLIITLRCDRSTGRGTDERNHADPSDLGERQLHVQSKDMRDAIGAACRKTGNKGVHVGSELYVRWTGKRKSRIEGAKAARTWDALYVPHTVDVSDDGRGSASEPPTAQTFTHAAQPAWPPQPNGGHAPTPAPVAPPAPPQAPTTPSWQQQQPAAQATPAVPPWEQQPQRPAGPPPASPWEQQAAPQSPAQSGW